MNRKQRRAAAKLGATREGPRAGIAPTVDSSINDLLAAGMRHQQAGRLDEADTCYQRVLALQPTQSDALHLRGLLALQVGRYDLAVDLIRQALQQIPRNPLYLCNLGVALANQGKFEEAIVAYRRAIGLKPDYAEAHSNLGVALTKQGKLEEAMAAYRWAIGLRPDYAEAYNSMGFTLKELGQFDEARQCHLKAIELDPNMTIAYLNLADSHKFVRGDPYLVMMEALAAKREGLSNSDRFQLDFALGKAYADLEDHARSFWHLLSGNAGKRATMSYDEQFVLTLFDRIEAVFMPELIAAKSGCGDLSPMPIFVLGMPRSGTTLIEQIIASHPMVHGAGELPILSEVVLSVRGPDGKAISYPEFVPALDDSALKQIGARYIAAVRELAPESERVTDKLPSNYLFAGLIHLALPNAKIVHTIRDPVDTCISCFSKLFDAGQNHTYDLGELGRYYRRYERLMAHWRRALPVGRILDVRYEDVVADLEGQARRIMAYCSLPWDDRCLSFHSTDRPIRTLSATQVRKPIYNSAIGRWRAYEAHLGPLLSALGIATRGEA